MVVNRISPRVGTNVGAPLPSISPRSEASPLFFPCVVNGFATSAGDKPRSGPYLGPRHVRERRTSPNACSYPWLEQPVEHGLDRRVRPSLFVVHLGLSSNDPHGPGRPSRDTGVADGSPLRARSMHLCMRDPTHARNRAGMHIHGR